MSHSLKGSVGTERTEETLVFSRDEKKGPGAGSTPGCRTGGGGEGGATKQIVDVPKRHGDANGDICFNN